MGNEDVIAVHGLKDLNSEITLKGGKITDIRTLLKTLPATTGMSRNRLFQAIDPNAGLTCTIATFQQKDKPFVEQRKPTIDAEIRSFYQEVLSDAKMVNQLPFKPIQKKTFPSFNNFLSEGIP